MPTLVEGAFSPGPLEDVTDKILSNRSDVGDLQVRIYRYIPRPDIFGGQADRYSYTYTATGFSDPTADCTVLVGESDRWVVPCGDLAELSPTLGGWDQQSIEDDVTITEGTGEPSASLIIQKHLLAEAPPDVQLPPTDCVIKDFKLDKVGGERVWSIDTNGKCIDGVWNVYQDSNELSGDGSSGMVVSTKGNTVNLSAWSSIPDAYFTQVTFTPKAWEANATLSQGGE